MLPPADRSDTAAHRPGAWSSEQTERCWTHRSPHSCGVVSGADHRRLRRHHRPHGRGVRAVVARAAHPGEHAPNVIVILFDDLGFSHFGCYGSDLPTPNIDRLAAGGLRYSNFHVTPLCSPTRAALLTGRNHHTRRHAGDLQLQHRLPAHAGPHQRPGRPPWPRCSAGPGYATFMVGKWHLCPMDEASAAGPYDNWPLQRGFDRFYGFLDGETDQFTPDLTYDNHRDRPAAHPGGGLPPHRGPGRQDARVHQRLGVDPPRPAVLHLPGPRGHPRAPPGAGRVPRPLPGPLRRRLGRGPRAAGSPASRSSGSIPPGTDLAPRNPGRRAVGRAARGAAPPGRPPPGGVRRVPRAHRRPDRPARRRPRADGRCSTTPSSCCSPTTAPAARAARSACCTR